MLRKYLFFIDFRDMNNCWNLDFFCRSNIPVCLQTRCHLVALWSRGIGEIERLVALWWASRTLSGHKRSFPRETATYQTLSPPSKPFWSILKIFKAIRSDFCDIFGVQILLRSFILQKLLFLTLSEDILNPPTLPLSKYPLGFILSKQDSIRNSWSISSPSKQTSFIKNIR